MKTVITQHIQAFLDRGDWSCEAARNLESYLDDCLDLDASLPIVSLREDLASYAPGGGHLLFDRSYIERLMQNTLAELVKTSSEKGATAC